MDKRVHLLTYGKLLYKVAEHGESRLQTVRRCDVDTTRTRTPTLNRVN